MLNPNAEQTNDMKYSADEEEWESVITPLIIRKIGCQVDGANEDVTQPTLEAEQNLDRPVVAQR
jgi:hypothetical protein